MENIIAYRRVPYSNQNTDRLDKDLGYLIFHRDTLCAHRYTTDGTLINVTGRWYTDFDEWLVEYGDVWTLDPAEAYYPAWGPEYQVDIGL